MPTKEETLQLCADLGLEPQQVKRLQRIIHDLPKRLSEVADLGHASAMGRKYANRWVDVLAPNSYINWRSFTGSQLLLESCSAVGLTQPPAASILPFLDGKAPVRHLRRNLAQQLAAAHLHPWPTLRAPLPAMLLALPKGAITNLAGTDDEPAVLGLHCADGEHGLVLRWLAWGWAGNSWHSSGHEHCPAANPLSRLAWSAIGLLNSAPEERMANTSPVATGAIRNRRQRPAPSWLEPPVVYRRPSADPEVSDHRGPVRAHWRRAHCHRFRCGPGRKQLTEHWIPALWCSGDQQEEEH